MTTRILIIPARKGSKRIKNKNIKKFNGKPIIAYSILAAKKSKLFNKIHISTNCKKIKKISEQQGIKFDFYRPEELSKNNIPIFDVLKHVTKIFFNKKMYFDEIWCLLPCSPLIKSFDLINIAKKITNKKIKKPILSVASYPAPIKWAFEMKNNSKLNPLKKNAHLTASHDMQKNYFDTGNFCIFDHSHILKNNSRSINNKFYGHQIPNYKAVDIDEVDDWDIALKLSKID
jgi:pseudaminic acid cytidylyltransferase|tara:strand:- start:95 stop:787 length:693 start_codon:yes stop_codon:yes gene_type:complete